MNPERTEMLTLELAPHCQAERELIALLDECQAALATALNSLGQTIPGTLESGYVTHLAIAVNQSIEAFSLLRKVGQVAASKLLVRPAIEAIFMARAAVNDRSFLFSKAFTEWQEDNNLLVSDQAGKQAADAEWASIAAQFAAQYPTYPREERRISVKKAAAMARLSKMYEVQYSLYCKFAHSALDAIRGRWSDLTTPYDTRTVAICALNALELLKAYTPAVVPDITPLTARLGVL